MLKKTKMYFLVLCYKSTSKIRLGHFSLHISVSEALLILYCCNSQSKWRIYIFCISSLTVQKIKCWEFMCFTWDHWWLYFLLQNCTVLAAVQFLGTFLPVPRNLSFDKICYFFFPIYFFPFLLPVFSGLEYYVRGRFSLTFSTAYSANLDFTYK